VPHVTADVTTTAAKYVVPAPPSNPESLPPLPSGNIVYAIKYRAWTFDGTVPGPVIHAQVGDTIDVTLTNKAMMGTGLQTAAVPPGGGAVVDFTVQQAGMYPVVTHSFGDADAGALGLFKASE
jgi:hypothetical protein